MRISDWSSDVCSSDLIVRSNIAVAKIILGPRRKDLFSGFMIIPLDMRAPHGLATLAIIITATPGTLWVDFDSTRGTLMIHVLDQIGRESCRERVCQYV